jgi:hypothetical protein
MRPGAPGCLDEEVLVVKANRVALVLGALSASVTSLAFAAAESYATDMATYISGDGKATIMAFLAAIAGLIAIFWIARRLGVK